MKPIKYFELDLKYDSKLDPSKLPLVSAALSLTVLAEIIQEIQGKQFLPNSL